MSEKERDPGRKREYLSQLENHVFYLNESDRQTDTGRQITEKWTDRQTQADK